jgi:hypothetical protein
MREVWVCVYCVMPRSDKQGQKGGGAVVDGGGGGAVGGGTTLVLCARSSCGKEGTKHCGGCKQVRKNVHRGVKSICRARN